MNPTNPGEVDTNVSGGQPEPLQQAPPAGLSLSTVADKAFFFPLVCLYVMLVHFGSLVRFSGAETSRGPSTVIVLTLIALGLGRVVRAFLTEALIFWTAGFLVLYLALLSGTGAGARGSLTSAFELGGYVLLAAAISRTRWQRSQLSTLWTLMAGALFVSSALTIVDYAGIVDVPFNNDATTSTSAGGLSVWQASGFFARRSGMAAVFVLSITGSLVLALSHESFRKRIYFLAAASAGLLCLFLTHNRSGVLGTVVAVVVYTLVSPRFKGDRRLKILLGGAAASFAFLLVLVLFFPEHVTVYRAKLGFIGLADTTWESDQYRFALFVEAIKSIGTNPLGNGFTLITLPTGVIYNPHNVVTAIIWAVGIFSFLWLPLFSGAVYLSLGRRYAGRAGRPPLPVESDALSCALFAWLINGMTHNTIFTALAWVSFGLMLSIRYFDDPSQTRPATSSRASMANRPV